MPARETSAQLGRKPTRALLEEGLRTDPQVSEPSPTTPKLAASPPPVPPDDPPVPCAVLYGLRAKPGKTELMLSRPPRAHSDIVAFARMIAPAWRSRATAPESLAGTQPSKVAEPPVVCNPAVS